MRRAVRLTARRVARSVLEEAVPCVEAGIADADDLALAVEAQVVDGRGAIGCGPRSHLRRARLCDRHAIRVQGAVLGMGLHPDSLGQRCDDVREGERRVTGDAFDDERALALGMHACLGIPRALVARRNRRPRPSRALSALSGERTRQLGSELCGGPPHVLVSLKGDEAYVESNVRTATRRRKHRIEVWRDLELRQHWHHSSHLGLLPQRVGLLAGAMHHEVAADDGAQVEAIDTSFERCTQCGRNRVAQAQVDQVTLQLVFRQR
mmetsp:Transcript_339/g.883  ORF Transcript_339/g.883 Transcript_339/m.883 type:complete len:265 (+) Transcript_339:448-1242(+)